VSKFGFVPNFKPLDRDEWLILRETRLLALQESPDAFLATYEREKLFTDDEWRAEFDRGAWNVGTERNEPVSLLGVTRERDSPDHERCLEYLWVAPACRRSGVARTLLDMVLDELTDSGVRTAFLWVLDDNNAARRLYQQTGFVSTQYRQPLADRPGRSEERMRLDLRERQADRPGSVAWL